MNVANVRARSHIIRLIRRWFDEHGFEEMHTPRLVGLPGQEPHLEPFETEVGESAVLSPQSSVRKSAALITSPEYAMKRLLAEGLDRIYDLGPCFRNGEPWDGTHDPEFLLLEWYRRDAGIEDLMRDTEEMVRWVGGEVPGTEYRVPSTPFRRMTVSEAWKTYAGIDLEPLLGDREAMADACRSKRQTVADGDTWDDLFFKIFLTHIEPHLGSDSPPYEGGARGGSGPTFLHRYPLSMAALARPCADDPRFADRIEFYAGGLELANGFAELADPIEQRKRFEEERALRQKLGKKTWSLDERFLAALPKMGNAAGIAFGVDRFVMWLTGASSINDILPFPARERFGD
ncbi:EF-P lysine aminoacylase GenX [Candidatus Uhrbacteria bacterium]|nr:EF-P lysine aminoacylase GenX [Candidatus Uhrbacteria bacterium]